MDARVKAFDDKMQKAYDFLLSDYQTIRAGRANPHVLDKLKEHSEIFSLVSTATFNGFGK